MANKVFFLRGLKRQRSKALDPSPQEKQDLVQEPPFKKSRPGSNIIRTALFIKHKRIVERKSTYWIYF